MAHTNQSLINCYLEQLTTSANNPSKSLSFIETRLKSYDSWLADIRKAPSGTKLFINVNITSYSNTTKKHVAMLVKSSNLPIRYWNFNESNWTNISLLFDKIKIKIETWKRARSNKPFIKKEIKNTYQLIGKLLNEYQVPSNHTIHKQYKEMAFTLFANKLI